jgi:hypothetical protein
VAFKEKCVDMAVPFDRMHIIVAFIPAFRRDCWRNCWKAV